MIPLLTHINHVVEAPFLDVFDETKEAIISSGIGADTSGVFAGIKTAKVGDSIAFVPGGEESDNLKFPSKEISLRKGQTIVFSKHTSGSHIIAERIGTNNYVCVAVGYESSFEAQKDTIVRLACGEGISGHSYTISPGVLDYYAYMEDKESGKKTAYVPSDFTKIDETKPASNDNCYVCFTFKADEEKSGLDKFDDRAKLSLYIYNKEHTQAWYKDKAYRVKKTQIEHSEEYE